MNHTCRMYRDEQGQARWLGIPVGVQLADEAACEACPKLAYDRDGVTLYHGDCRAVMAELPQCSVDAIVTDPPYEIAFMAKGWDNAGVAFEVATWAAALRVLKPGGHLLAFGAPRTHHRLMCAIEDAGFEVRDCLMWLFGSGFPKSLDVSKALDKAAGVEREVVGIGNRHGGGVPFADGAGGFNTEPGGLLTAPATDLARQWQGWGTSLKPAYEPIILARKPLIGTVAANVQRWGTGGLNIDGTRIGTTKDVPHSPSKHADTLTHGKYGAEDGTAGGFDPNLGRWPANVALDAEAARLLDAMSGESTDAGWQGVQPRPTSDSSGTSWTKGSHVGFHVGDRGGASRFFFQSKGDVKWQDEAAAPSASVTPADVGSSHGDLSGNGSRIFYTSKASRAEREFGLDDLEPARRSDGREKDIENPRLRTNERRNDHATVKPIDLMRWLCRLVTPPGGMVLDPFVGSGSTGIAALAEGFCFTGIDLDAHYLEIAQRRITRRHLIEAMPQAEEGQGRLL